MTKSITWMEGDDEEMLKAIAAAQASYHLFVDEMALDARRVVSALQTAAVKAFFPRIADPGGGEHMWVLVREASEAGVAGELISEPQYAENVFEGQEVSIP